MISLSSAALVQGVVKVNVLLWKKKQQQKKKQKNKKKTNKKQHKKTTTTKKKTNKKKTNNKKQTNCNLCRSADWSTLQRNKEMNYIMRKRLLRHMRRAPASINLHIRAIWSDPTLHAYTMTKYYGKHRQTRQCLIWCMVSPIGTEIDTAECMDIRRIATLGICVER